MHWFLHFIKVIKVSTVLNKRITPFCIKKIREIIKGTIDRLVSASMISAEFIEILQAFLHKCLAFLTKYVLTKY